MFTRDSKILSHRLTTPLTSVANAVGDVFKPTYNQIIKSLFANGEQGFFYDPNDLSTMWQDQAKLLPVTGEGQPVRHILDKSGNNNHAFATSSATRPILRKNATTGAYYLAFDGADDSLVTNNIDFTATDKVSLFAGVRKLGDTAAVLAELSVDSNTTTGNFLLSAPNTSATYTVRFRGTLGGSVNATGYLPPHSAVLFAKGSIANKLQVLRVNGVPNTNQFSDMGTGNYSNYPLYIGRRAGTSLPFNGHLYSLIGIGRLTTDSETAAIEKELAKRTGVTLNV